MKFLPEIVIGHHNGGQKVKNAAERILVQIGHIYADRKPFLTKKHLYVGFRRAISCADRFSERRFGQFRRTNGFRMSHISIHFDRKFRSVNFGSSILLSRQRNSNWTTATMQEHFDFAFPNFELLKKGFSNPFCGSSSREIESLLSYLLEWKAPMQRERKASKELLSLLCDRIGFEEVQKFIPESYGHVMRNLRKQHRRTESQMETSYGPTEMEIPSKTDKARTKSLYSKTESRGASLGNTWKSKSVRSQQPSSIPDSGKREISKII